MSQIPALKRLVELRDAAKESGDWDDYFEAIPTNVPPGELCDFAALLAEVEALRADKARLDWIEAQGSQSIDVTICGDNNHGGQLPWLVSTAALNEPPTGWDDHDWEGNTLRDAFDAALAPPNGEQP